MNYELISRATCAYCLGSAVCYECGGLTSCEECTGGVCAHCENGREIWLMFEHDGKRRGSCLTRAEIIAWRERQELPEWWNSYYGIATAAASL